MDNAILWNKGMQVKLFFFFTCHGRKNKIKTIYYLVIIHCHFHYLMEARICNLFFFLCKAIDERSHIYPVRGGPDSHCLRYALIYMCSWWALFWSREKKSYILFFFSFSLKHFAFGLCGDMMVMSCQLFKAKPVAMRCN